jgi:hypothetical protein
MNSQTTVVFVAVLACSFAAFRYFGRDRRTCPFCGTKTGEHADSCVWRPRD